MEPNQIVDFESAKSHFFYNPRLSASELKILESVTLPELPAHIWLASSGTTQTSEIKLVALSKKAFLIAAAASNRHLEVSTEDIWYKNLPDFHVGGLSILARAQLSGSKVVDDFTANAKWEARFFSNRVQEVGATLISLVPTQIYDLVQAKIESPKKVRAVLVGGGALSPELFIQARELGWPLLITYGMTEVCSQIATARLQSLKRNKFPEAIVLDHIEVRTGSEGVLELKSGALFSCLGFAGTDGLRIEDPKVDGWYRSGDRVDLDISCEVAGRKTLRFLGRVSDLVKVNGELVSLAKLQVRLNREDSAVFAKVDARSGARLCVATTSKEFLEFGSAIEQINQSVAPYERLLSLYFVDELPRTPLGKIKIERLKADLNLI